MLYGRIIWMKIESYLLLYIYVLTDWTDKGCHGNIMLSSSDITKIQHRGEITAQKLRNFEDFNYQSDHSKYLH